MDDKIEAWVQRALDLAHDGLFFALDDHLRTTPECYRLVPVEPTEAMTQNALEEIDEHGYSVTMGYTDSQIEEAARKAISRLCARPLYEVGHLCCVICERVDWLVPVFYRPYNKLMIWSHSIERWAGTSFVWKPVNPPSGKQ